jgi:hypothetical protein
VFLNFDYFFGGRGWLQPLQPPLGAPLIVRVLELVLTCIVGNDNFDIDSRNHFVTKHALRKDVDFWSRSEQMTFRWLQSR